MVSCKLVSVKNTFLETDFKERGDPTSPKVWSDDTWVRIVWASA